MKVLDRNNIQIEIWERGAGYTLASGSSSSAAAAVAHRLGLCDREISVHMPGGIIEIEIGDELRDSDDRRGDQGGRRRDFEGNVQRANRGLKKNSARSGSSAVLSDFWCDMTINH